MKENKPLVGIGLLISLTASLCCIAPRLCGHSGDQWHRSHFFMGRVF